MNYYLNNPDLPIFQKVSFEPLSGRSPYSLNQKHSEKFEICFTGFKKAHKEKLAELAEVHNMIVRGSVTTHLDFLCCGYNAGPKKVEKSRMQGVVVFNEPQFLKMIETGELPEEG